MRKWRIHKENGKYIPQRKWLFFWIDIVVSSELFDTLMKSCYTFTTARKYDSSGIFFYSYRPEFNVIDGAIYCAKMYDEYGKNEKDEEKIEDYYLDDKYEVRNSE